MKQVSTTQAQSPIDGCADGFASNLVLFERMESALLMRLNSQPDNQALLFQLAECKRKQGKSQEALEYYKDLYQRHPTNQKYRFIFKALCGDLTGKLTPILYQPHPSPLVEYTDFLEVGIIQTMLTHMYKHQADFRPAGSIGKDNKIYYGADTRNNTQLSLKGHPLKKTVRERIREELPEIKRRLGLEAFEVGQIEVQLRAYHHGEYFRTHQDGGMSRRINFVCFFYPEPKRYIGGELVIFDTDTEKKTYSRDFTRVIPVNNQIVFFPSNYFHAVLPVTPKDNDFLSGRFVINGHVREKVTDD